MQHVQSGPAPVARLLFPFHGNEHRSTGLAHHCSDLGDAFGYRVLRTADKRDYRGHALAVGLALPYPLAGRIAEGPKSRKLEKC